MALSPVIPESQEHLPNFRTELWRKDRKKEFRNAIEKAFKSFSSKITGVLEIEYIEERYRPEYRNHYELFTKITSYNKIDAIEFAWNPLENIVEWKNISVREGGVGIGTQMKKMVECITQELYASKLVCVYILDRHYPFWEKQSDYTFDPTTSTAVKHFS